MSKLSSKDKSDIIKLYTDGKSPAEIGKLYNIYSNSVNRIIRKFDPNLTKNKKINEELQQEIINLYKKNISSENIAKTYNINGTTVCRILKRNNINIRSSTENKRKYLINQNYFQKIDSEAKAYFLGFLYADGNVSKLKKINNNHAIKITLNKKDRFILEQFSLFIYNFIKIKDYSVEDHHYSTFTIYSKKMCEDLIKLGCVPNKSLILKFPTEDQVPEYLIQHFIRGYFDGDGCLSRGVKYVVDITSTENFLNSLNEYIIRKIGISFNKLMQRHKDRETSTRSMQLTSVSKIVAFLTYLYKDATIFLPRKKDYFDEMINFYLSSEQKKKVLFDNVEINKIIEKNFSHILEWVYKYSATETNLDRKYQKYIDFIKERNIPMTNTDKNQLTMFDEAKKEPIQLSLFNDVVINPVKTVEVQKVAEKKPVKPRSKKSSTKSTRSSSEFERIVEVNGQPITTTYVKSLDLEERLALVEPLFQHFRKTGWLYPDNESDLKKSYQKLLDLKVDLTTNELFNNSSLATDICKFFCHKFYEATEHKQPTMKEVFNDDDKLRYLIKNRLGLDWWENENNDETFNICFRMLIQGMRSARLVPSISIFKPDIAKYMYMKYSAPGETVFDYSAGWGGRMLGAAAAGVKYIGVDPWTTDELENIVNYFNLQDITLIKNGSENVRLEENSIDFCFSSPPYYDQEVYSKEETQAYNKGEDHFYNVYWKNTLENIKHMLKPGKYFGLNIKNFPKMLEMAKEVFGEVVEEVQLRTVRNHLTKNAGVTKYEPIYMFINNK